MKLFIGAFFLSIFISSISLGKEIDTGLDWSTLNKDEVELYLQEEKVKNRKRDYLNLKLAKYYIISGNLRRASHYLGTIHDTDVVLGDIKKRYLSLIHFITGNYKESLKNISNRSSFKHTKYNLICTLKIINLLSLQRYQDFKNESEFCSRITIRYEKNNNFWVGKIADILRMADGDEPIVEVDKADPKIYKNDSYTAMWFKLGLYLNKEEELIKYIPRLLGHSYLSKEIREVIGFLYHRIGRKKRAIDFVEDIDTSNAHNIRGNIHLENGKYKDAYESFKQALIKNNNSTNAIERTLPLTWYFKEWDYGLKLLDWFSHGKSSYYKKLALASAFNIRKGDYGTARNQIDTISSYLKSDVPIEVDMMNGFLAIMLGEKMQAEIMTSKLCRKLDVLNCWIISQRLTWENFSQTIKRNDTIFSSKYIDIEKYKQKTDIVPLKENIVVDQKDIEELDKLDALGNPILQK